MMENWNKIILHCSATPEGRNVKTKTIKGWHLKRGWRDIGYHYVIQLDGTVDKGRPIDQHGAHTKGRNHDSIGICYIGGLDAETKEPKDTMTEAQHDSFLDLMSALRFVFGPLPLHGHNEYAAKACPCFDVQEKFGDLCER